MRLNADIKKYLRKEVIHRRNNLSSKRRNSAQSLCSETLLEESTLWCSQKGKLLSECIIAGYFPLGSELSALHFFLSAQKQGAHIVMPVMIKNVGMTFFYVTADELEKKNLQFCINPAKPLENDHESLLGRDAVQSHEINIVIVPVVGFCNNNRLGYGGGNYDKFLSTINTENQMVAGIAFYEQKIDNLPCESHDITLPNIFTF